MKQYDTLIIVPRIVAESVARTRYTAIELSDQLRSGREVERIEAKRVSMSEADVERFIEWTDNKCRRGYAHGSGHVFKALKNGNVAQLRMWVSHWLAAWLMAHDRKHRLTPFTHTQWKGHSTMEKTTSKVNLKQLSYIRGNAEVHEGEDYIHIYADAPFDHSGQPLAICVERDAADELARRWNTQPDLLAACEDVFQSHEDDNDSDINSWVRIPRRIIPILRAAITRATP